LRRSDALSCDEAVVRIPLCFAGHTGCDIVKRHIVQALACEGLSVADIQTRVFDEGTVPARGPIN